MDHIVDPRVFVRPYSALSLPPPMGSSPAHWLLGAFPTLPLSQQSVAVDLPLRLVSVSCFHVPKCASFVLPLFLIINTNVLCSCFLCSDSFPSSPGQCSSVPVLIRFCLLLGLSGSALGLFWVLPGSAHAGRWQSKRAVTSLLEALFDEVSGSNCSDCGTVNTGIAHRKILDRRSKPGPRNGADLACMGEEMGPSGCPRPLPLGWLL